MTKIVCVTDWYLPAFKAGGPVRSLSNLVSALAGNDFEFYVLTRDRDAGDRSPYSGVALEQWTRVGNAKVLYTGDHSLRNVRRRINEVNPDVIYVNSFFSSLTRKVLLLHRFGKLGRCAVIVAPRGELSPGALRIKWTKKLTYIRIAARTGLYRDVFWHATADLEKSEIAALLSRYGLAKEPEQQTARFIHVASNVPGSVADKREACAPEKRAGEVRFIFVSRVSPKKNLLRAMELLAMVRGQVTFDIYGPVDDAGYWRTCEALIARAPCSLNLHYCGAIPHTEAQQKFSRYHFFLFPTFGENYGHVIAESLAAGCPVVISDKTPWSGLELKNVGWDLPLDDEQRWVQVLQHCVDMGAEDYRRMSLDCIRFFQQWARSPSIRDQNVQLFRRALGFRRL
jgi:glycosyltransferase involved in cell wall biosynthesis